MKQLLLISLIWIFALPVFALGGVGVGNGRTAYTSPAGFSVQFANSLTLNIASDSSFEISNSSLVPTLSQASKIVFDVSRDRVKTLEDLKNLIAKKYPAKVFEAVRQPGAQGFFWEDRTDDQLSGMYFLLTSNGDLVSITLTASSYGNGVSLIEPIVKSFTYDTTAPVISAVYFQNKIWGPGSRALVYLKITDDCSGVQTGRFNTVEFQGLDGNKVEIIEPGSQSELKSEGNNRYSFEFTVSKFAKAGPVQLSDVVVNDNAGNFTQLYIRNGSSDSYYQGDQSPLIPIIRAEIKSNLPADLEAPKVLDIRLDRSEWKSGTTQVIHFKMSDNLSGVSTTWFETNGMYPLAPKNGRHVVSYPLPHFRAEGNGWYALSLDVSKYMATGDYLLPGFLFSDNANNVLTIGRTDIHDDFYHTSTHEDTDLPTKFPILIVHVTNVGGEDTEPPKILDWKPLTPIAAGSTHRLYFQATDDFSGISKSNGWAVIYRIGAEKEGSKITGDFESLRAEGNNWYSIELKLNPFLKAGDYFLGWVSISDNAGNREEIRCFDFSCVKSDEGSANLPRLTFTVTR